MITATDLELRAGSRILLSGATLRVQPGDRIGLVGRNGAGKTTPMRVLAGEGEPYGGAVSAQLPGRLPAAGPARGRPARHRQGPGALRAGLDVMLRQMEKAQTAMAELVDGAENDGPCASTAASRSASPRSAGTPPRARPPGSAPTWACPTGSSTSRSRRCPAASAAASSWPASCSRPDGDGGAPSNTTLLLDEPTNHLDADSITWLRSFLQHHDGGLVVISHDTDLLPAVVNKVWFLDATRGELDVYNMTWQRYQEARATDEKRRRRERANAEKKASRAAHAGAKMGAKATKAVAAKNMARRADKLLAGLEPERQPDQVAKIRFPRPGARAAGPRSRPRACRKAFGSLEVFTGVDLAVDRGREGRRARAQRRGQDHAAAAARRHRDRPTPGCRARSRAAARLLRPGTRDARPGRHASGRTSGMPPRTPASSSCARCSARSCSPASSSTSRPARCPAARRPGSRWPAGVERGERPAARRADEQPRPGQPRAGARRAAPLRRAPWYWSPTTRAR